MMENAIGNIVGVWFVAQVLLTGAAVVAWLAWGFGGLVIKKPRARGKLTGASRKGQS